MTKAELLEKVLKRVRYGHDRPLTKVDVEKTLHVLWEVLAEELHMGESVSLPHLGKLLVKECAARQGRNPKTGEALTIPAHKKVVFAVSKELKETLKAGGEA